MRFLVAFLVFFLASCWQDSASHPVFEARTAYIYDGDSFLVKRGRNEIEVRLYGLDAPEKEQPWSAEALQGLRRLIDGKMLRIEAIERDRYDRLVARVYRVGDNLYINAEMIAQGHAWVYRRYTDERQLIKSEKAARRKAIGLWQLPKNQRIAPWDWRKEHPHT